MKVKKVEYNNEQALIVYVTQSESLKPEVKAKIMEYKKLYAKVAVFVSGDENIEKVIKNIVKARL